MVEIGKFLRADRLRISGAANSPAKFMNCVFAGAEDRNFPDLPRSVFQYAVQQVTVNSYGCRTYRVRRRGRRAHCCISWSDAVIGTKSQLHLCESAASGGADAASPCAAVIWTGRVDAEAQQLPVIPPKRANTRRTADQIIFENSWKIMT